MPPQLPGTTTGHRHRGRVPAVHQPRLCSATFAVDETHFACPVLRRSDRRRLRLGPPAGSRAGSRTSRPSGPTASIRSTSPASGDSANCLPVRPPDQIVTIGEGQTLLQRADKVGQLRRPRSPACLWLQYEGMNPSGSFKDNGMTAAFTHARMVGARRVACASTGNTSAALAVYCSATDLGFRAIIFIGSGKIAYGKLAQALDHGALTIQIVGDFDDAMQRVRQVADRLGIYLMNSVNPFRLEGQKTIIFRVLEACAGRCPTGSSCRAETWEISSAFGKAFIELQYLGLIERCPVWR